MPRATGIVLGSAVLAAASGLGALAGRGSATIAHRPSRLVVDGSHGDWEAVPPVARFAAPTTSPGGGAVVTARLCWDRATLWGAFEVVDPQVHLAPVDVSGPALFQWDSVEIYLDGLGDRAPRMGSDDFQVIITADGRTAVLEGDPLLAELEPLSVPKRERAGVAIPTAARRTPSGYLLEVALPWAAFGLEPGAGARMAVDLAVNDWDAGHPAMPMLGYHLATLNSLANKRPGEPGEYDAHGLAGAAADRFAAAHYHPWSWSGSCDFGHPEAWLPVMLVGSPPLLERVVQRTGARGLVLLAGSAAVLVAGLVGGCLELRHRRQIAGLMARISRLDGDLPDAATTAEDELAPPTVLAGRRPTGPSPVASLEERIAAAARRGEAVQGEGPPARLETRAVGVAVSRLAEPLTPAQLAEELCVSLRTLQRELAAGLLCTPRELIIAVKMRRARTLLDAGWRVQEVAVRVGFDDASHFSRRFKAYFGLPPSEVAARADAGSTAA